MKRRRIMSAMRRGQALSFDAAAWSERAKRLSAGFLKYPDVYTSYVTVSVQAEQILFCEHGRHCDRSTLDHRAAGDRSGNARRRWHGAAARGDFPGRFTESTAVGFRTPGQRRRKWPQTSKLFAPLPWRMPMPVRRCSPDGPLRSFFMKCWGTGSKGTGNGTRLRGKHSPSK